MKRLLDEAAANSGRSQSQEAEMRLEHSFDRLSLLPEVLRLVYGRDLAAVLIMLGDAMQIVGEKGGFYTTETVEGVENWLEVPYAFDQAAKAANHVLEILRPPGEIKLPDDKRHPEFTEPGRPNVWSIMFQIISDAVLRSAVTKEDQVASAFGIHAREIRELLGPELIKRIKRSPEIAALLKIKVKK
jgi:hypothetical protein